MARAIIGKSKGEAALDKMIKFMEKSDRHAAKHGRKIEKVPTLVEQIKKTNPDNWKQVLAEMVLERDTPGYLSAKNAQIEKIRSQYWNQPRAQRTAGLEENKYIAAHLREWRTQYLQDNNIEVPVITNTDL